MPTNTMKPAIVIATYNRPESLYRLLHSVDNAIYEEQDIPLVISIDGGGSCNTQIQSLAEKFEWPHGQKKIICYKENLGLRKHILSCGDLSEEYGAVIVLEDDIFVAQHFYGYTQKAIQFYHPDERIAQISLYSFSTHIHTLLPFNPLRSMYDTYFVQYPCSWGQCWTKSQWKHFRAWYNEGQEITSSDEIPKHITKWPDSSWLKYFIKYLVVSNKFVVYPYLSYSTNFNDAGVHNKSDQGLFQSHIAISTEQLRFAKFDETAITYDVYFEISKYYVVKNNKHLQDFKYDFEIDLYGVKYEDGINASYLLSTRKCKNPIIVFPLLLKPIECNLIQQLDTTEPYISLAQTVDFKNKSPKILLWEYFTLPLSFELSVKQILMKFWQKIALKIKDS